jgi:hypothetical protein
MLRRPWLPGSATVITWVKHIKKWVATAELAIDSPLIRQQEKRGCAFVN